MLSPNDTPQQEKDAILHQVIDLLEAMTADWETGFEGKIGPETCLVADLEMESLDLVKLAERIEERFRRQGLPYHELIMTPDGDYVEDIRVSELADFLYRYVPLNSR